MGGMIIGCAHSGRGDRRRRRVVPAPVCGWVEMNLLSYSDEFVIVHILAIFQLYSDTSMEYAYSRSGI